MGSAHSDNVPTTAGLGHGPSKRCRKPAQGFGEGKTTPSAGVARQSRCVGASSAADADGDGAGKRLLCCATSPVSHLPRRKGGFLFFYPASGVFKTNGGFSILAAGFSARKSPRWGPCSTLARTLHRRDFPSTQTLGHPSFLLVKFEGEVLVAAVQLWGQRLWVLGIHSQAVCREGEPPSGKPEAPHRPLRASQAQNEDQKTSPGPSGGCGTSDLSPTVPKTHL